MSQDNITDLIKDTVFPPPQEAVSRRVFGHVVLLAALAIIAGAAVAIVAIIVMGAR